MSLQRQKSLIPAPRAEMAKAPVVRRVLADLIDRLVPLPFLAYFFPAWIAVCLAYDLLADGRGASVGKWLFGLEVAVVSAVPARHGSPCNMGRSLLRNGPWCLARICYMITPLAPLGFLYDATELAMALFTRNGRRLGDLLAGTQVTTKGSGR